MSKKIPTISDRERFEARLNKFEDRVRAILREHESKCLDNSDDVDDVVQALVDQLGPQR